MPNGDKLYQANSGPPPLLHGTPQGTTRLLSSPGTLVLLVPFGGFGTNGINVPHSPDKAKGTRNEHRSKAPLEAAG